MTITTPKTAKDVRPVVSVIIPAYKVARFIRATLDSVITQTFADYEIIVINDGSPDTEELEQQLEPYSTSIIYLTQTNQGAGAARNAGIRAANGEFVAFLDGDDIWLPEFLEEQLALVTSAEGFDLVYADAANLEDGRRARMTNMDFNPSTGWVSMQSLIEGTCNVITSTVVARRNLIVELGLFDENFPNSQDFDLWLRFAKHGARISYQKKVLALRRIYQGSLASNPVNSFRGEIAVLEKTLRRGDLTEAERAAILRKLELRHANVEIFRGKERLSAGEFDSALTAFRTANNHYQSWKLRLVVFWLQVAPRLLQRVYRLHAT
jgi:glycosyltransferase involved in cell wall biosynthesis